MAKSKTAQSFAPTTGSIPVDPMMENILGHVFVSNTPAFTIPSRTGGTARVATTTSSVAVLPELTGDGTMDAMLKRCLQTLCVKGNDYTVGAGSADRLFNFREGGRNLGIPMEKVWGVYWWKHVTAVLRYCKEGRVESEPIEDRIMDCIVYLLLLSRMIEEGKKGG